MRAWFALFLPGWLAGCGNDKGVGVYNTAPGVSLVQPVDGATFDEGEAITFQARVDDDQTAPEDLLVTWSSDVDGVLDEGHADASGLAVFVTGALSPATHTVQVDVVDDGALSATDWVTVTVIDLEDDPTITVRKPAEGDSGVEEEPVDFEVVVADEQDDPEDLGVWIESDLDGTVCEPEPDASGLATCSAVLSVGVHALTFGVTDTTGNSATEERSFEVLAWTAIDDDGDGYTEDEGDCDDTDSSVYPGAEEHYDGVDEDCDGVVDEGTVDFDDDGDGYTELDGDCDDDDAASYPDAEELCDGADNDCDGEVDEGTDCFDDDGDGFTEGDGDCDDADPDSYPGGEEVADGADNDCDGTVDEGTDLYDDDGDCYCESGTCTGSAEPSCTTLADGDCDDTDADVNPDGIEVCNGVDDDCDGTADGASAADATTYWRDGDGDGYGDPSWTADDCSAPSGYVSNDDDCDDSDASVSPAGTETCNGVDDDCDGSTDEGVTTTYYRDADGDGYGDPSSTTEDCSAPSGYVANDDDCDDADAALNPTTVWYLDYDGDGYGGSTVTTRQCTQPSNYVDNASDCDDTDASTYPGATETCDGTDNDCDGTSDEAGASGCTDYYYDYDGDGYGTASVSPICYCTATGYYSATNDDDCYDYNANANPAATSYHTSSRGDGSYDYNCDGSESRRYTSKASCRVTAGDCEVSSSGWGSSSIPSCGSSSSWSTTSNDDGCSWSWSSWSCEVTPTTTNTQSCR